MLILTRKKNQDIIVTVPASDKPRRVVVRLCRIGSQGQEARAKVGVHADDDVHIVRAELESRDDRA